jgi:hypothetical protein
MTYPTSSKPRLRALVLGIALALSTSNSSLAAPSPSDIATARKLVVEGRKLKADKDWVHAIEKLRAAYQLYPTPVTGDELALCYRDAGRLIEAREMAITVGRMPVESDEGKASKAARDDCASMVVELAKKIGQVVLSIQGAAPGAALTVTLDGNAVPMAAINEAHMVDPGKHVAVVSMAGATDQRMEFDVAEGENKKVVIQAPLVAGAPPPATTTTATSAGSAAPAPTSLKNDAPPPPITKDTGATKSGTGWLTYVGFGVAGVGAVVGTISGITAIGAGNRLSSKCDQNHVCNPSEQTDVNKLNTMSTVSTLSFAVAGVGLVAAILDMTMNLTAESKPVTTGLAPTPRPPVPVRVSVGAGTISLGGEF